MKGSSIPKLMWPLLPSVSLLPRLLLYSSIWSLSLTSDWHQTSSSAISPVGAGDRFLGNGGMLDHFRHISGVVTTTTTTTTTTGRLFVRFIHSCHRWC